MNVRSLPLQKITWNENFFVNQSAFRFTCNTDRRLCIYGNIGLHNLPFRHRNRFLLRNILFYREKHTTFISNTFYIL